MFNFLVTNDGTISVFMPTKNLTITKDNPQYEDAKKALAKKDLKLLERIHDVSKTVKTFMLGNVAVEDGIVKYRGEEIHGVVVIRILSFIQENLPVKPLLLFLNNLMENPSKRAVDELYTFLEHKNLPLTDDGCFLAYKRVNEDWLDFRTNKFLNKPGCCLKMPRNQVCDDKEKGCESGFHAGSLEYVRNFNSGKGHIVVVKINPKDVVSVPSDCDCQKLRTAEYLVLYEFTGELTAPLVNCHDDVCDDDTDDDEDYDDDTDNDEDHSDVIDNNNNKNLYYHNNQY